MSLVLAYVQSFWCLCNTFSAKEVH